MTHTHLMRHDSLDVAVLQQLLTTQVFGRTLHLLAQTTSTNDVLKALARQGAPEGTVVLAEQQTRGRGRQGRTFASPAGVGIYLSVLVRPTIDLARLPQLTLMVAVATADAITDICGLSIHLKWPNDVEIDGRKVAGILTEAVLRAGESPVVIIGIGINVNTALEQLPAVLHDRVTSLALATGVPVSRHHLIARLLARCEERYHTLQHAGVASILERWRHYGRLLGRVVQFSQATETRTGRAVGLDDDGALVVQTSDGVHHHLVAGEVIFL
jgi:BirA family transcriptional regulator, biotin operon repressor / biotin---[acetyl-CoA-carboxylase] ligase